MISTTSHLCRKINSGVANQYFIDLIKHRSSFSMWSSYKDEQDGVDGCFTKL